MLLPFYWDKKVLTLNWNKLGISEMFVPRLTAITKRDYSEKAGGIQ